MSLRLELVFDRTPPQAGRIAACRVKLVDEYRGDPAVVVVIVESDAGTRRHYHPAAARAAYPAGTMIPLEGLELPVAPRARFVAGLAPDQTSEERRTRPADLLASWQASVGVELAAAATTTGAAVLVAADGVDSVMDVISARDARGATVGSWQDVFDHVAEGLGADLAALIRERYVPYPDEIGEDGQPLTSGRLEPWQRWVIQYCTGLYYSAAYRVNSALRQGVGYPMAVECDTLTDTCAWARGLELDDLTPTPPTLADGGNTPVYEALGRRAGARWDPGGDLDLDVLRPGSMLTFDGHIDTVLRVRRSERGQVSFLLFDTGGVAGGWRTAPDWLLRGWGGVMKEERWRTDRPAYDGGSNPVTGHLFVPAVRRTTFPRTMFIVPPGTTDGVTVATRQSPTVQLCIVERATGALAFRSAALPLRVPFTQLHHSVSALPSSDAWEARWIVDGGEYSNHQTPRRGRLFIEIFNDPAGQPRHWRSAYTLHAERSLIAPRHAEYLEGDGPPRSEPHEARLAALVAQHAPGSTVELT